MTKTLAVIGLLLTLGACSHTPLRPVVDCEAVLGLRLGQSPDDVRALIGKPHLEQPEETYWGSERGELVADYGMWFNDFERGWLPGTGDLLHVVFLKNRLVRVSSYRSGFGAYPLALYLGSPSYGLPSLAGDGRVEPIKAEIGPAFRQVFRCRADVSLEKPQADFAAQVKTK